MQEETRQTSGGQAPQSAGHLCFLALLHHSNQARGRTRAHGLTWGFLVVGSHCPCPATPNWPIVKET